MKNHESPESSPFAPIDMAGFRDTLRERTEELVILKQNPEENASRIEEVTRDIIELRSRIKELGGEVE